jgi:hypothetical protein
MELAKGAKCRDHSVQIGLSALQARGVATHDKQAGQTHRCRLEWRCGFRCCFKNSLSPKALPSSAHHGVERLKALVQSFNDEVEGFFLKSMDCRGSR